MFIRTSLLPMVAMSLVLAVSLILTGLAGCALGPSTLKLKSSVIDNETVWSGEVSIDGIVTVKKSGKLVIEPGTRILFVHRDLDGDGIGDSELLIEGALVARGTAESPIVFTSASAQPQRADWKYLYLDFATEVDIDYIVSEYAYSGLQIHFCRARVTNSIFRHNVDGLRFSTVNLMAAGNQMYDNQHGLRYEERRGQAHLHHNDIRDNDVGVFVVTRSTDKALIEQNNIADNRQYNVKLGWQQPGDVTLPRNWWGTMEPQAIKKTFLDQDIDGSLGRVSAPQPLSKPIDIHNWQEN